MSEETENHDDNYIKVYLRIKPKINNDLNLESNYLKISEDKKSLNISLSPENETKINFENIFNENESQKNIFEVIGKPLSNNALEGKNSSFISYGKKNTGKTYTILGKSIHDIQKESQINGIETDEIYYKYLNNRGLFDFCLQYIFNNIFLNEVYKNCEFDISFSYIEIFDNIILDYFNILNFEKENEININNIFNNKNISDLSFTKLNIISPDEAFVLLNKGNKVRKYIFNKINLLESSGNIILTIYIQKINKETKQIFKSEFNFIEISSNFNLVNNLYDISVQKSLETFSYIINQLSDNVKRENIIYDNSTLTRIIKESIGGNTKTSILINISPYNVNMINSFQSISLASKMKNIKNNPKINEINSEDIDLAYFNELVNKIERLKSEKNYLLNYLANININTIEKNIENVSKKNINLNNKEKEENLETISNEINIVNSKIDRIKIDKEKINKEKKQNFDKHNKIEISLFVQNNEIQEKKKSIDNFMKSKKEKEELINKYNKDNINLDSLLIQKDLQINEQNLKKEEESIKLNKEISITELQVVNKENELKNLKEKYNNLIEEDQLKNKIKNQFEEIKAELNIQKEEKIKRLEELNYEYEKMINQNNDIKQQISDKNSLFNNFKKNLEQYNQYENITMNFFKKYYNENSKKEIENNNKFFDIQKYVPEKEKELKKVIYDIENTNKEKMKFFEEQEKIKKGINDKEQVCKNLEHENLLYNNQINNLNRKISILTNNINIEEIDNDKNKNNELNSSIISYEVSNHNNEPNDLFLFKNNFNVNLDDITKEKLLENKKKLLDQEQKENIMLKEKKNMINNEIYKFKINQLKVGNNNDKTHSQYNIVKIEENIDKINEKDIIIKNYQNCINNNYNIIKNYLEENKSNDSIENNEISPNKFRTLFSKFIERSKEIDAEFELIKKEFKEREVEYRNINKEVVNASLKSNPLLKNYEEIFNDDNDNNNNLISSIRNKNENVNKRITMMDNKILSDVKNISIYNGIYSNKRKLNDYLKTIPENEELKFSKRKNICFSQYLSENRNENIFNNRLRNNKELNIINSTTEKEYKSQKNKTNIKTQIINKTKKNNNKFIFKSPDKIPLNIRK